MLVNYSSSSEEENEDFNTNRNKSAKHEGPGGTKTQGKMTEETRFVRELEVIIVYFFME